MWKKKLFVHYNFQLPPQEENLCGESGWRGSGTTTIDIAAASPAVAAAASTSDAHQLGFHSLSEDEMDHWWRYPAKIRECSKNLFFSPPSLSSRALSFSSSASGTGGGNGVGGGPFANAANYFAHLKEIEMKMLEQASSQGAVEGADQGEDSPSVVSVCVVDFDDEDHPSGTTRELVVGELEQEINAPGSERRLTGSEAGVEGNDHETTRVNAEDEQPTPATGGAGTASEQARPSAVAPSGREHEQEHSPAPLLEAGGDTSPAPLLEAGEDTGQVVEVAGAELVEEQIGAKALENAVHVVAEGHGHGGQEDLPPGDDFFSSSSTLTHQEENSAWRGEWLGNNGHVRAADLNGDGRLDLMFTYCGSATTATGATPGILALAGRDALVGTICRTYLLQNDEGDFILHDLHDLPTPAENPSSAGGVRAAPTATAGPRRRATTDDGYRIHTSASDAATVVEQQAVPRPQTISSSLPNQYQTPTSIPQIGTHPLTPWNYLGSSFFGEVSGRLEVFAWRIHQKTPRELRLQQQSSSVLTYDLDVYTFEPRPFVVEDIFFHMQAQTIASASHEVPVAGPGTAPLLPDTGGGIGVAAGDYVNALGVSAETSAIYMRPGDGEAEEATSGQELQHLHSSPLPRPEHDDPRIAAARRAPGYGVTYKISFLTANLARERSQSTQLSQTQFGALQLPFIDVGLAGSNSYVENFFVGVLPKRQRLQKVNAVAGSVPGPVLRDEGDGEIMTTQENAPRSEFYRHFQGAQIVPNSAVEVHLSPLEWELQLVVNPGAYLYLILYVCTTLICSIFLCALVLDLKERKAREADREKEFRMHFINS
ncbi:unnamed protein product [Amoebophrya sp. A25]|nr:unnamed protein product [Amoebophrya sp. A25]|eukprot:GSA25T00017825001.1